MAARTHTFLTDTSESEWRKQVNLNIEIRTNGIRPDNVVAEWETKTTGGAGDREVLLSAWSRTEIGARQKLFEQAKAMRDELNQAIEKMIEELCAGIGRS
jgi:hypothetical protein